MSQMNEINKDLRELLAEARAIHLAASYNAISYEEAKKRVEATLKRLNEEGERIAKEFGVKHKKITFQNLGVNLHKSTK